VQRILFFYSLKIMKMNYIKELTIKLLKLVMLWSIKQNKNL